MGIESPPLSYNSQPKHFILNHIVSEFHVNQWAQRLSKSDPDVDLSPEHFLQGCGEDLRGGAVQQKQAW